MLTRRASPSSCFRSRVGGATEAVVVTGATAVMVAVVVPGADRCADLFSTALVERVVMAETVGMAEEVVTGVLLLISMSPYLLSRRIRSSASPGQVSLAMVGLEAQAGGVAQPVWRRKGVALNRPSQTGQRVVRGRAGSPAGEAAGELVLRCS